MTVPAKLVQDPMSSPNPAMYLGPVALLGHHRRLLLQQGGRELLFPPRLLFLLLLLLVCLPRLQLLLCHLGTKRKVTLDGPRAGPCLLSRGTAWGPLTGASVLSTSALVGRTLMDPERLCVWSGVGHSPPPQGECHGHAPGLVPLTLSRHTSPLHVRQDLT